MSPLPLLRTVGSCFVTSRGQNADIGLVSRLGRSSAKANPPATSKVRSTAAISAGIVADSDPTAEWRETKLKTARLLAAAGGDRAGECLYLHAGDQAVEEVHPVSLRVLGHQLAVAAVELIEDGETLIR